MYDQALISVTALSIASGVAGAFKFGLFNPSPERDTASLRASQTEIANIKGGSPIAFDL